MKTYTELEKQLIQALIDVYEAVDVPTKEMTILKGERMRNDALTIMHPILVAHQGAVRK